VGGEIVRLLQPLGVEAAVRAITDCEHQAGERPPGRQYVRDDRPFCGPAPPGAVYFYSPGGKHVLQ
jgi:hypothetical protein